MKKSKKKRYLVVALVVLLLAMALGYAVFSSQLNITGTATAKGGWNVHFENATISPSSENYSATISTTSSTSDTLTVNVDLTQPGETCTVYVDVVNGGTVDATLSQLPITVKDGNGATITEATQGSGIYKSGVIEMELNKANFNTSETIAAGQRKVYSMTFTWDEETTYLGTEDKATFTIELDYEQSV